MNNKESIQISPDPKKKKIIPRGFRSHERVRRKSPEPKSFLGGIKRPHTITDTASPEIVETPGLMDEDSKDSIPSIDPSMLYEDMAECEMEIIDVSEVDSTESLNLCSHNNTIDDDGVVVCQECGVNLYDNENEKSDDSKICPHENVITERGILICENCGTELYEEISHEQEWRSFGNDSRDNTDQSRCQYRRAPEKGIKKDLENMMFDPDVCEEANRLYMLITRGEMKKSNLRKGIEFACVFWAHVYLGRPKTPDEISSKFFNLSRRTISQGLKFFALHIPRDQLKTESISVKHFISITMKIPQINAKQEHIDVVNTLYDKIKDKCTIINRANPQSASKALVYYYLRRKGVSIDPARFGKIVSLSFIILLRLSSAISQMLGTTHTVKLM